MNSDLLKSHQTELLRQIDHENSRVSHLREQLKAAKSQLQMTLGALEYNKQVLEMALKAEQGASLQKSKEVENV